jgi:hypothetical protein
MTFIAALTWPEAAVRMTFIATVGIVVAVLVWSIFRTGQTAIKFEPERRKPAEQRSREADAAV